MRLREGGGRCREMLSCSRWKLSSVYGEYNGGHAVTSL